MNDIVFVALGGALGSVLRYKISGVLLGRFPNLQFPLPTFVVNVLGCFLIGILGALIVKHGLLSREGRLFLITGTLGGFTTFSAFGLETFSLLRSGHILVAFSYALLSVLLGLAALSVAFYAVPKG